MTTTPNMAKQALVMLIESAFAAARSSGKNEWRRMTTAVLKNRLLQQTEHRFDERDFGFASLPEMLESFPDLVRLDFTTRPTTVEFVGDEVPDVPASSAGRSVRPRIREDLWRSMLDYSAGHSWVWDK